MHSKAYRRYVTFVMLTVYVFNQVDARLFGFLMEPIKADLGLSDTQLGFLAGPALLLCYATLGIPVARWADRSNRVTIMSAAVAIWSGAVAFTAAVGSFWQMAAARIGVGMGEAGFPAVAQSLVSDYHSAAERTRALSILMLAIPIGGAVSSLMGGWINEAYGWRAAFIAAGVPGIALALLMKWTVREPFRGTAAARESAASHQPALLKVFETAWKRYALRHLTIAMTTINLVGASMNVWLAAFFIRSHGVGTGELGIWMAGVTGAGAAVGTWMSFNFVRWTRATDERAQVRILACSAALFGPLLVLVLLWPSAQGAMLLLVPAYVLKYFLLGPMWSLFQGLCTSAMRATLSAFVIFGQQVIAAAIGLQLVGMISDVLAARVGARDSLRWALIAVCAVALWSAVHFWMAGRTIRQESQDALRAIEPQVRESGKST